jgi:hypothetical protein
MESLSHLLVYLHHTMASNKPTAQTIEMASADDVIRGLGAADPVIDADVEEDLKQPPPLPRAEDQLDALGIPNWRVLEKQVVRRLDLTLMPCLTHLL